VKRYSAKNNNSPFTCHLFCRVTEFREAKNMPPSSSDLNLVNFLLRRALQHICNVKRCETLISWNAFCYIAEPDKPRGNTTDARTSAIKCGDAVYGHSYWPSDVHNEHRLWILNVMLKLFGFLVFKYDDI